MLRLVCPFLKYIFMVATLPLIIPIGINILNITHHHILVQQEKRIFFYVYDWKKYNENYIFASCLTSAPSCGTLAAIPNPKSFSCLDEKSTGFNRFISQVFKIICIVIQIKLHNI